MKLFKKTVLKVLVKLKAAAIDIVMANVSFFLGLVIGSSIGSVTSYFLMLAIK